MMKVITTKVGFYGKLRKIGEEFEIENDIELGSWMQKVEVKKAKPKAKAEEKK